MGRQSTITALPEEVRRFLERALTEQNFSGYEALEEMMRDKGYAISKSAIHRHGQKIERRMAAIKASTEAAKLIVEAAGDDQDARSESIIALVQTEMFDSIIAIQEADDDDLSASDRLGLMSKAAKNIATLTRASIVQKQYKATVLKRLSEMEADARTGKRTLDAETLRIVREELYGA
jgi:hypothetical protein